MCDPGRLYFDGCAGIFCNGNVVAMSSQFGLSDVEVVTAVVDLEDVRSFRTSASRSSQASQEEAYQRIEVPISLSRKENTGNPLLRPSPPIDVHYFSPEEEISLGPACCKLITSQIQYLPYHTMKMHNTTDFLEGFGTTCDEVA